MDRLAVLQTVRRAVYSRSTTQAVNQDNSWRWKNITLVAPDIVCPFCKQGQRMFPYVHFFTKDTLVGYFKAEHSTKILPLRQPNHPNGPNHLCLGWSGNQSDSQELAFIRPSGDHNRWGRADTSGASARKGLVEFMSWFKEFCNHGYDDCPRVPWQLLPTPSMYKKARAKANAQGYDI